MSDPIELDDYRQHMSGIVECQACWKRWVGVAPTETQTFECPDCGSMSGKMLPDDYPLATA